MVILPSTATHHAIAVEKTGIPEEIGLWPQNSQLEAPQIHDCLLSCKAEAKALQTRILP
jgi:hypothetical protein